MGDLNWNELLPGRTWRQCNGVNWAQKMPPPLAQLVHLLPENSDGSCAVHSFAEALTTSLRIYLPSENISVDLPTLLEMCVDQGVIRPNGAASFQRLSDFLAANGVPLLGGLPDHFVLGGRKCDQVDDHQLSISALGNEVFSIEGYSLPAGTPTSDEAEAAMGFRELLCEALEMCPVVICFPLQYHYLKRREEGEPYQKLDGDHNFMAKDVPYWLNYIRSFFGLPGTKRMWHCVTAFAYECPGGDVRTMRVHYQENSSGAPDAQPGRHCIDANAIEFCFLPIIDNVYYRNTNVDH